MEEFNVQEPVTETLDPSWQTDLSRDEYSRYYSVFAKLTGPLRLSRVLLVVALLFAVAMGAILVYEWVALQLVDWLSVGITAVLTVGSLALWWYAPRHVRRTAEKQYDRMIDGGYSFAGSVRVRGDRVEKENAQGRTVLPLSARTLFIETPEMMVFYMAGRPAIVLPARYLTAEAATALRQAADKLPYRNRRFLGRVQPQGETPVSIALPPQTTLWESDIRYEPQEMEGLLRFNVMTNYVRRLPLQAVLCMLCAVGIGLDNVDIVKVIGSFLVLFALLTLFNLVMPLRRTKMMAQMAEAAARTVSIKLTDRGVWLSSPNSGFVVLPWGVIEHIINRDTFVEITYKVQSIRIPKRYIEDFSAFDALISTHWKKTDSK